jgi:hypothetical protein
MVPPCEVVTVLCSPPDAGDGTVVVGAGSVVGSAGGGAVLVVDTSDVDGRGRVDDGLDAVGELTEEARGVDGCALPLVCGLAVVAVNALSIARRESEETLGAATPLATRPTAANANATATPTPIIHTPARSSPRRTGRLSPKRGACRFKPSASPSQT